MVFVPVGMALSGPKPWAKRPNSSVLDWIHCGPSLERLSSSYSATLPVSGSMAVPFNAQCSSYHAVSGGTIMALAAVPMARRCLSGLRRLLLLRREPVGVVAGASGDGAVRGLVLLIGPGAGAGAMEAVGTVDTRGGVLGVATA